MADYTCQLHSGIDEHWTCVSMPDYPRFSEPVDLFAARAIFLALSHGDHPLAPPCSEGELTMALDGKPLRQIAWRRTHDILGVGQREVDVDSSVSPWQLAQWALSIACTGVLALPALPAVLRPAVYQDHHFPYCRLSEIPEEARRVFLQRYPTSVRPQVPACPDACDAWDVLQFIDG